MENRSMLKNSDFIDYVPEILAEEFRKHAMEA
jgi:hypothetical protein